MMNKRDLVYPRIKPEDVLYEGNLFQIMRDWFGDDGSANAVDNGVSADGTDNDRSYPQEAIKPAEDALTDNAILNIRALNNKLRLSGKGGVFHMTPAVLNLSLAEVEAFWHQFRGGQPFDESNNPLNEYDFGVVQTQDHRFYWVIDTYDRDMNASSINPTDPTNLIDQHDTKRVLTIMLASECHGETAANQCSTG